LCGEGTRRKASAAPAGDGPAAAAPGAQKVQRFGSVIGLKPEKADQYVRLHAAVWPQVLATIRQCNIRNYSIYLGTLDDGRLYLFAYFEYAGKDFQADMKKMAADPVTQRWWKLTDPCQIPQKDRKPGEHWMTMREVFHMD
jgi:L-rhamnose mutarotase